MLSQLDGSTERQNTKPSTNKGEISQAKHNQFSLQSQLLFCISKPMFQEPHRLLHGAGNWNRTPQQHGQQQDSAAHMPSTAWVSGSPSRVLLLTLPTGSQRNHTTVHPGRLTGKLCCSLYPANMEEDQKVSRKGINGGVSRFLPPQFYPLLTVSFLS